MRCINITPNEISGFIKPQEFERVRELQKNIEPEDVEIEYRAKKLAKIALREAQEHSTNLVFIDGVPTVLVSKLEAALRSYQLTPIYVFNGRYAAVEGWF